MDRYEDKKSTYQKPLVKVIEIDTEDILTTSPGTMNWDGEWGDFKPGHDNTFVE